MDSEADGSGAVFHPVFGRGHPLASFKPAAEIIDIFHPQRRGDILHLPVRVVQQIASSILSDFVTDISARHHAISFFRDRL